MHLLSGQLTPSQSLSAPVQQQNRSHREGLAASLATYRVVIVGGKIKTGECNSSSEIELQEIAKRRQKGWVGSGNWEKKPGGSEVLAWELCSAPSHTETHRLLLPLIHSGNFHSGIPSFHVIFLSMASLIIRYG